MDPATLAIISALISAGGSAASSYFGNRGGETPIQGKQRELVDQLLESLNGKGQFSDLFATSEEDFNKNFREPAMNRFRSQIVPSIQQGYLSQGQEGSSGFEDALTRAGVNMDDLLNQQYLQYQQGGKQSQLDMLSRILGLGAGSMPAIADAQAVGQGFAGYLSNPNFPTDISAILKGFRNDPNEMKSSSFEAPRVGYQNEPQINKPYTGVQQYGNP